MRSNKNRGNNLAVENRHFPRANCQDVVEQVLGPGAGVTIFQIEHGNGLEMRILACWTMRRVENETRRGFGLANEMSRGVPELHFGQGGYGRHIQHLALRVSFTTENRCSFRRAGSCDGQPASRGLSFLI